jgi:hypothetical protein
MPLGVVRAQAQMFLPSSLSRKPRKRVALLLLLLFAVASSGCSRYTRTRQCRALIAQVNPALDDVITMEFSTEDMAKTVAEYAAVITASAQSLRALAAALDSNNYGEAERANRDLERLSAREHAAIVHIDAWCQPGT